MTSISLSPFVNTKIVSNFYFDLAIKLCLYQPPNFTFCLQFFSVLWGLGEMSEELDGASLLAEVKPQHSGIDYCE